MSAVIDGELINHVFRLVVNATRLDAPTAREFKRECQQLWPDGVESVVIDLGTVEFIDSSGIGALLSVYERLPGKKLLTLLRVRPPVQLVVELLRLQRILQMES